MAAPRRHWAHPSLSEAETACNARLLQVYPHLLTVREEAVERYGALLGGMLALWRILRCNPFSHGGYDPVPEKRKKNKF